jgi:hypothetical protein
MATHLNGKSTGERIMIDEPQLHSPDDQETPDRTPLSGTVTETSLEANCSSDPSVIDGYEDSLDDIESRLLASTGC